MSRFHVLFSLRHAASLTTLDPAGNALAIWVRSTDGGVTYDLVASRLQ